MCIRDSYITKPYNVPVLLARISNLLKRIYKDSENEIVEYKDLTLFAVSYTHLSGSVYFNRKNIL